MNYGKCEDQRRKKLDMKNDFAFDIYSSPKLYVVFCPKLDMGGRQTDTMFILPLQRTVFMIALYVRNFAVNPKGMVINLMGRRGGLQATCTSGMRTFLF